MLEPSFHEPPDATRSNARAIGRKIGPFGHDIEFRKQRQALIKDQIHNQYWQLQIYSSM
jgi:hypothetical protein